MTSPSKSILSLNAFDASDYAVLDERLQTMVARRQQSFSAASVLFYREPLNVERAEKL